MEETLNVLATLENGLFALGQVLRLPVMALLWVCVATALFMSGQAVIDALMRRRERAGFDVERWLNQGPVLGGSGEQPANLPKTLIAFRAAIAELHSQGELARGGLEHALLAHEELARKTLSWPRMLVRVGPSLGLIGTLIPMGTALAALASGNLEAMSGQMIVAFTTTIIGIACGTIAFVIAAVRQAWVTETVRELRFIAERVASETED